MEGSAAINAPKDLMMETDTQARIAMPRIGDPAPDFTAKTTMGPRSLADYRGKCLILFSHPADFTPVCTTEFMGFAKATADFAALDCALLGLSIDSVHSHIAWVRTIKEKFGVDITFPIIDDLSMQIAHACGMIHPGASDTAAVRATFIIDPEGIVRAMVYYPMSNGRSVAEVLRLLEALQTADANMIATPEGWQPGVDVIVPPPAIIEAADARAGEGYAYADWFFSKRPLAA